ncbi:UDP-N-acetylglucosamine 2-epimerase (non-hydrolyzing) [Pseudomonas sp. TKO26]|uniref:non-hydrolyzing UDP-N-acetylglucosamine 2-epimerase n=1 Tax=unclassified Pseudomonas TaxID=196821 RepID=UPI000D945934|nr:MULTISPECIES: UDP-N-acetylglucosamine 2-epimerase (non-hydrolyzing) [unclassified Pseudomonas]PYY90438.1 UDP-N-acetylglucosamine 2-epimerase (non-hydrolyzing) [Pseudomonas sp. TKO30]PYY93310.1 UDP-N-acetylglucosamine 2-epimerase (non-hydrolyzing) [Pseudomonas sp. TKO29]PYY95538.1 UDP-N-acetylglucosamine 2-epimerase (non-hydrolyzing) [Pseudomonas sp. TKO26]PYZ01470.1 UDP-N-acetylglucosamine 2-epimerase (non-hydrolyzing) [Pseudomonas sp. TKO14]
MHLAFVLGTRPEIIKLSSLMGACIEHGIRYTLIHTNQHYDATMDRLFFEELELPLAHFNLGVGSDVAGSQVARMVMGIEPVLQAVKPDYVIVQGDTNSSLAGGLAARKVGIPIVHVEAGLRSFDPSMPEETNRIQLDQMSDFWFCPSPLQVELLANEGIQGANVHITGNTGNDATLRYAPISRARSGILESLGVQAEGYLLLTCHRPSNTDDLAHFAKLINAVQRLAEARDRPVIFPVHPRLGLEHRKIIDSSSPMKTTGPLGYIDMLALLQGADLVLTDSGGLQEEACVLQRRCLVLRANTERPESLDSGGSRLAPVVTENSLVDAADELRHSPVNWSNPFGDGQAGQRILQILRDDFGTSRA